MGSPKATGTVLHDVWTIVPTFPFSGVYQSWIESELGLHLDTRGGPDNNLPCFPLKETCSLGGYVYGTKTKRVWALICGHIVFPNPGCSSLPCPIHVNQPSDEDYEFGIEVYTNAANELIDPALVELRA